MDIEKYREALQLLVDRWESNEHDWCACMGPMPGHELCHCKERVIVLRYMKEALQFVPPPNRG